MVISDGQLISQGLLIGLDAAGATVPGVFLPVGLAMPQPYDNIGGNQVDVNLANTNNVSPFLQTAGVSSFRLIVTTGDTVPFDMNNLNGVQTAFNAAEAADQNFAVDSTQPVLLQAIINTAGDKVFFVFSESMNTGFAPNDPNHTVLTNVDTNEFEISTDNGLTFGVGTTLLSNPTFIDTGKSIIQFDRAPASNLVAGSTRVRPAFTAANPPAVNHSLNDAVKNQATSANAAVTTQVALAVTGSRFLDTVPAGGGTAFGALKVTFNNPVTTPGTADAYALRRLNVAGTAPEASQLILANPQIDPNDPFSVLIDVTSSGTEGVAADGRSTSNDTGVVPNLAAYTVRVDSATGATDPGDVFGGTFSGQTDLPAADGIEPSLLFVAFGDTSPVDGHQDTVYFVYDEPMANISSTAGFTVVRQGGVTVQPFQSITNEGTLVDAMTVVNVTPANNNLAGLAVTRANIDGGGVATGRGLNNAVCLSYDALGFDWDNDTLAGLVADANEAIPGTGNANAVQGQYLVATGTIADAANNAFMNAGANVSALAGTDNANPRLARARIFDGDNMPSGVNNSQAFSEQDGGLGQNVNSRRAAMFFGENLSGGLSQSNVDEGKVAFGSTNFGNNNSFLFVSGNSLTFDNDGTPFADRAQLVPGVVLNILEDSGIVDANDNEALSSVPTVDGRAPYLPLVSPVDPGSSAVFSAFLADTNADGFANEIRINMNQPILASSVSQSSFSITPGTITGAAVSGTNPNAIVITITDGVVSMNNTVQVTYNGASLLTQVTSDAGAGGTGIAVSAINDTFDAQRVPVSQLPTQAPAIMDLVGVLSNGATPLPAGTKIYAMIATPVVKRITATHNNANFIVDADIDTDSLEAWTNWLYGFSFAKNVYLGRDSDNFQFYSNFKDIGGSNTFRDVIQLTISARALNAITFTGRGETTANVVSSGSLALSWDVARSSGGTVDSFYRNGYQFGGTPITSRAVVTGDDGRFEMHISAPIAAFDGLNFLNSIDRPIILIVEQTDGKRFAVTSLLSSVNGAPLLFRPQNRTQTATKEAVNATSFNINIANVGTVNVFPGWNLVGFARNSGFAASTAGRPTLPAGVTAANVVSGSTLPFVGALEQFVFWEESTVDNMWLSTEDSDFRDIIIDSKCFNNFAFTMTSLGVQIGSGINNLVGGYGFGFFVNTNSTYGIFQFGAPLTGAALFAAPATFANSTTNLGWALVTARQDVAPATALSTGNATMDFIILFRNNGPNPPAGRTRFEVSSLDLLAPTGNDNPNDTKRIDAGQAFFGHFR